MPAGNFAVQLEQDDVTDKQTVPTEIAGDTNVKFFENRIQDFDPLPSVDRNFAVVFAKATVKATGLAQCREAV